MTIGFTGTREGMSEAQRDQLWLVLNYLHWRGSEFHHGGARGADSQAADIARSFGFDVHCHPCPGVVRPHGDKTNDVWHEVFPPLVRNRHIARLAEILVAAPRGNKEELRSGTWATVREARRLRIPVIMLSR